MGGGRRNKYFVKRMNEELNIKVKLIDYYDFNGDQIEGRLNFLFNSKKFYNIPFTFPNTTGVLHPTKGGKIFYPI